MRWRPIFNSKDIEYNFPKPLENESLEEYLAKCKQHLLDFPYLIVAFSKEFNYYPIKWEDDDFESDLKEIWEKYNTSFRERYLKSIKTSISNLRLNEFKELKQFILNYNYEIEKS